MPGAFRMRLPELPNVPRSGNHKRRCVEPSGRTAFTSRQRAVANAVRANKIETGQTDISRHLWGNGLSGGIGGDTRQLPAPKQREKSWPRLTPHAKRRRKSDWP